MLSKELVTRVMQAVPFDRPVAVRDVRRSVAGIRAEDARRILDALAVRGIVAEQADGRYLRLRGE